MRAEVEGHVETCHRCQETIASIRRNVEIFEARREQHLGRLRIQLAAEASVQRSSRQRGSRQRWGWKWIPAIALPAVAAAMVLVLVGSPGPEDRRVYDVGFKGSLAVRVVAKRGDRQFIVNNGARLTEGDALRFILTTSSAGYVTVFSVDARHQATPYYPDADPAASPAPHRLAAPGRHVLPGSVILDDSPGIERIAIVFSATPFRRDQIHERVVRALKRKGASVSDADVAGMSTVIIAVRKAGARR